jgi:hypothetical protein
MTAGRARLLTLLTLVAVALCACAPVPVLEGVIGLTHDPHTGAAQAVQIGLPADLVAHRLPAFYLKTGNGEIVALHTVHVDVLGDRAALTLTSAGARGLPVPGQLFTVFFREAGRLHAFGSIAGEPPRSAPQPLANADFTAKAWGALAPPGWTLGNTPGASYWVEVVPHWPRGIRLSVSSLHANTAGVALVSLDQLESSPARTVRVRFRPFQNCTLAGSPGDEHLVAFAGVGLTDAAGRRALVCIAQHGRAPVRRTLADGTVVLILPGRLDAWNDVVLDPAWLWPNAPAPEGPLTVRVVAAIAARNEPPFWTTVDVDAFDAST